VSLFWPLSSAQQGGKAAGLRLLQRAGYAVPPYMVLDAAIFKPYLLSQKQTLSAGWQRKWVLDRLQRQLKSWGTQAFPLAVRSSAVGEDGQQHAYPGMLDTVLDVHNFEQLLAAIHQVASSVWSPRLQSYRREKNISSPIYPAVIIQQQKKADFSGVLFTTNPTYPNEMLVHVVAGAGDVLVGGAADPAEMAFDKGSGKAYWSDSAAERPLPSSYFLESLFTGGSWLENWRKQSLDIEFCIAEGQIWWLQMRAVTTAVVPQVVLDNSNIQESYCGVTTELTGSFAARAYQSVYEQTMRALGFSETEVAQQEGLTSQLLHRYKGRIYYNINNWYKGLLLLPSFTQNKGDMERMMGLEEPVAFVVDKRTPLLQKLLRLPRLLLNLGRLLRAFGRLKADAVAFQEHFEGIYQKFYAAEPAGFDFEAIEHWYARLNSELLQRWHVPIVNDFYVMMQNGKVHRQLEKAGVPQAESWLQQQLHSDGTLPSLAPGQALQALAEQLRPKADFCALVKAMPPDLHAQVQARFPEVLPLMQAYIQRFGDRTIGELKLETHSMRVEPLIFYKYLLAYLHEPNVPVVPPPAAHIAFKIKNLDALKTGIHRREALRLTRTQLFGMYRSLFRRAGQLWVEKGAFESVEEVFNLQLAEFEAAIGGEALPKAEMLAERQAALLQFAGEEVPARVYLPGRPLKMLENEGEDGLWHGQPAVPGEATGEAICIREPGEIVDLRGKIIVALRTDPGWAPLFPGCKAVIIEKGSALSHSVILLRELGIPTIINVPGISKKLQNGQKIRIDATNGHIQCL
jgi:rifampicin phosphotransferase